MPASPYTLSEDTRPKLGLVVLRVDETIEDDFRRIFPPEAARLHVTRLHSGDALTPDSISAMEGALPESARLLPPAARLDVVGYGCTSGTVLIGEGRVTQLVAGAAQTRAVTNPLTAAVAAIRALGLERIGILSPYIPSVAEPIRAAFRAQGIAVPNALSFGEEIEANVARIAPQSIAAAATELAQGAGLDGLFLSCTNLRTLDIIPELETTLNLPVLSSNLVLAWHMALLAGVPAEATQLVGRLAKPRSPLPFT